MKQQATKAICQNIADNRIINVTISFKSGTTKTYNCADFDCENDLEGIMIVQTEEGTDFIDIDSIERITI